MPPTRRKEATLARTRSKRAHEKVLDAAIELFAQRGIEGTSMDAIAGASGVSKATIYKHWQDKDALCLEVMVRVNGLDRQRPVFDSGDLRTDLTNLLRYRPPEDPSQVRERLIPQLIAYAALNRKFGMAWRSRVMEPQRAQMMELIARGIRQGYFSRDMDVGLSIALLFGPMMYPHLFGVNAWGPQNLAESVVNAFWRAFAKSDGMPKSARPLGHIRKRPGHPELDQQL
jgi:AcrR family transcriptional regulator